MSTPLPSDIRPTLVERAKNHFRSLIRGRPDVSRTSDYGMLSAIFGVLSEGLQNQAQQALRNSVPTKAGGLYLAEHARTYAADLLATKASGKVLVHGTGAQTIAAGTVLAHRDGRRFLVTGSTPLIDASGETLFASEWATRHFLPLAGGPANAGTGARRNAVYRFTDAGGAQRYVAARDVSFVYTGAQYHNLYPAPLFDEPPSMGLEFTGAWGTLVGVEAEVAGAAGNVEPGETLLFESTPANVDDEVTVGWIDGGDDALDAGRQRRRLGERLLDRGRTSRFSDVIRLCEELPEWSGAKGYVMNTPDAPGRWTAWLGGHPERYPYPPSLAHVDLANHLNRVLPAGSTVSSAAIAVPDGSTGPAIKLRVTAAHRPPWWTFELGLGVGSTANRVELDRSPAGIASVGDLVLVATASFPGSGESGRLSQRRVTGTGPNYLDLDEPLPSPNVVYLAPGSSIMPAVLEEIRKTWWSLAPRPLAGIAGQAVHGTEGRFRVFDKDSLSARVAAIPGVVEALVDIGSSIGFGEVPEFSVDDDPSYRPLIYVESE